MSKLNFYNVNTLLTHKVTIEFPDIYFTPEYGKACEYSDNAVWELCSYKDLIYVYLKQPIEYNNTIYYDLITPYGYSGYYYEIKETYEEFIPNFRKVAKEKKYITEVVRQNPYLNIKLKGYDVITSKTIYGVFVDSYENYYKNVLHSKKRNMITKANKNNLMFELKHIDCDEFNNNFLQLYYENMKRVDASPYYFFNTEYFNEIKKQKNTFLAIIKDSNKNIIGTAILFLYNNYIHYHLSCNNNSINCITDFLLVNVIKEMGINKLFILGGGLKNDDALSKFKKRLSNKQYNYTIYKNILNQEIYDKLSENFDTNYFPKYRSK